MCGPQALRRRRPHTATRAAHGWELAPVSYTFPAIASYALALGGGRSPMAAPLGF
jgi:hypothetical protein